MHLFYSPSPIASGSEEPLRRAHSEELVNLPEMQETWVRSLGRDNPLEKGMATHSSILAWRIPWTEEPGRLQSTGLQRVRHDWATTTHTFTPTASTLKVSYSS